MSNLARIVDYHRKELYYDAVKHHKKCKKILSFHGNIRYMYKHNKPLFWYKTIKWFICDISTFISCWWHRNDDISYFIETYWDTKYRIKVQHKLEERLDKYDTWG